MNSGPIAAGVPRRLLLFGTLLGWCAALLLFRFARSGSLAFGFLVWNLFLAAVPAVAAWFFAKSVDRQSNVASQVAWFAVWLVFLPNAPYIITDFVHLTPGTAVPLWYDIALLTSCAGTGLLLGYTSIADVQAVITRKFSPSLGWAVVITAIFLSGFGIYLGRFLRWNSWDTLTNPLGLFPDIARQVINPLSHPRMLAVTAVYGVGLFVGYLALRFWHPTTRS
jgi:uncharacterized membrane protein